MAETPEAPWIRTPMCLRSCCAGPETDQCAGKGVVLVARLLGACSPSEGCQILSHEGPGFIALTLRFPDECCFPCCHCGFQMTATPNPLDCCCSMILMLLCPLFFPLGNSSDETIYVARYSNCPDNEHAETFMLRDPKLRDSLRVARGGKLLLYLNKQPCHHSSDYMRGMSCTADLLAFADQELQPLDIRLEVGRVLMLLLLLSLLSCVSVFVCV